MEGNSDALLKSIGSMAGNMDSLVRSTIGISILSKGIGATSRQASSWFNNSRFGGQLIKNNPRLAYTGSIAGMEVGAGLYALGAFTDIDKKIGETGANILSNVGLAIYGLSSLYLLGTRLSRYDMKYKIC